MTLFPVVRCELPDGTLSHWWTAPVASLEAGEVAIQRALAAARADAGCNLVIEFHTGGPHGRCRARYRLKQ